MAMTHDAPATGRTPNDETSPASGSASPATAQTASGSTSPAHTPVQFASSIAGLGEAFAWARRRALDWVQTGADDSFLPSYWAGLTDRPMFYSRDLAHQALGAHLLGLGDENLAMFRHFAASATAARKFYPLWAFLFDATPAAIDYHSDDDFVRETPVVFELVEKGLEQYLWTGDRRWITDPDLAEYYRNAITRFTALHDVQGRGIAGEQAGRDIFAGSPTYNEASGTPDIQLAADALSSQWAATIRFAEVVAEGAEREELLADAARIKRIFDEEWWHGDRYLTGRTATEPIADFAYEPSWFPAVKGLMTPGERADSHLGFLSSSLRVNPPSNIEAFTYLPEAFFQYGHDVEAMRWIRHLIDSRADYPEVPFTIVSHLATGLTGLRPTADGALVSRSHVDEGEWVEARNVPVGDAVVSIRHDGRHSSTLTVHSGSTPVRWVARFGDTDHTATERTAFVPPGAQVRLHDHALRFRTAP